MSNVPPPLITPTDNLLAATVQTLEVTGSIINPSMSSTETSLGFFGQDPVIQQSGSATRNTSGKKTASSEHNMLLSIVNTLNSYGLMNYSQVFSGRTFTFVNLTTNSPALELYVTVGGVGNVLTSLGVFPGTGSVNAITYAIPTAIGWTGNFQVWPVGMLPVNELGATLFEISVNEQVYDHSTVPPTLLPLRDDWDISTVPPNIPVPQLNCGPRDQAVAVSYAPITSNGYGYFPGNNLSVSGGSGSGLTVDVVSVSGGGLMYPICNPPYNTPGIGGYKIRNWGSGYVQGDVLSILQPLAFTLTSGGTSYTTSTNVPTTGGTGSGLTVDILSVSSGVITAASVNNTGSGYLVNDSVTITTGDDNATFTVNSVTLANTGQLTVGELTRYQSQMYNVGLQVIPPAPPSDTVTYPPLQNPGPYWPPVTVIANQLDGNCPQAITYPNDTALPKSQVGYSQGNYTINIVDPTIVELA